MKKNDLILGSSVILYCFLFFQQSAGINFMLFTILLTVFLAIRDFTIILYKEWIATVLGSLLSAGCIVYTNSQLAVIANIISLSLMAAYSMNRNSSMIFSGIYSIYSYLSAIPFMFIDAARNRGSRTIGESGYVRFFIVLVPFLISLIFFFMYRGASPAFDAFAAQLNLDFLSWELLRFTLWGFVLLYGFFYHRKITWLFRKDMLASDNLNPSELNPKSMLLKFLSVANENLSGVVLMAMLNILLMMVNIVDLNYIIQLQIPEKMSYSDFVHQGTGMLITSIISAILIILYYFRGSQNYYEKNTLLRFLVYLWIFQNLVLILSTGARTGMYISEYGLTYKRIGVYVYLFLCSIGLVTTLIKIIALKTNWFLFRKNAWAFYATMICACFINWDLFITIYNLEYSRRLDRQYLIELAPASLPYIWKDPANLKCTFLQNNDLKIRTDHFRNSWKNSGWQSWSYEKQRIYKELEPFYTSNEEPLSTIKTNKETL